MLVDILFLFFDEVFTSVYLAAVISLDVDNATLGSIKEIQVVFYLAVLRGDAGQKFGTSKLYPLIILKTAA